MSSEKKMSSTESEGARETTANASAETKSASSWAETLKKVDRAAETKDQPQPFRWGSTTKAANTPVIETFASKMAAIEESRFDITSRERMAYEGSDRNDAQTGEAETMNAEATDADMNVGRATRAQRSATAGQKAYTNKPLTKKSSGPKTAPGRPRLIGICNQKGGVGKTTTAVNLATALAAVGKNVLIIDMDPQGNASTGLGVRRSAIRTSVYDVLFEGADVVEAAVTTRVPNLSVVPSSIHLSGAEIELVTAENREYRLKKALHRTLPYDYVIIDCPPSLNLLTLNALVAVDSILVPLQCEFYALEGLSHLVKTIERVQKSFNPALDIHGIILTMYDLRNRLSAQVEDDVRSHFGDKVYKTVIPRNVRLSEAPSYGLPAIVYDMKCSGSQAYIKLAREVIMRERTITAVNTGSDDGSSQVA